MDVDVNGVRLHVEVEGDGPPVLFVHGFPDSHRLWRHQTAAVRAGGWSSIAPDLRGFGASSRPVAPGSCSVGESVADLVGLLDHLGVERVHVVGHDWGAVVSWVLAALLPERVQSLSALSVGHPAALRKRSIAQREKQWYMLLFQFEDVAEQLLRRDDWALLREWTAGDGDMALWLADLSRPGALESALRWYRDNVHPRLWLDPPPPPPPVACSTLGLWSTGDRFLLEAGMLASAAQVTGPWRYERIEEASHWMQLDQPDRVSALLLEHLQGVS